MSKTKVFVVDDSATVRKVVAEILNGAAGMIVTGAAQDPIFAKQKMDREWPDVIVLDIEMPRMDGLTFLRKIMAERPTPVVMCSTLTAQGSKTTVKALEYGAVEVVGKPKINLKSSLEESSRELIDAVRAAARANLKALKKSITTPMQVTPKLSADVILSRGSGLRFNGSAKLVAIGTSTGGTQALEAVLPQLTLDVPGVVVVQHMPEKFTGAFASRLNSLCKVEVKEAEDNDEIQPGRVLIAPGGRHMLVSASGHKVYVNVKNGPPVNRHRPSVDVLFRSVAKVAGRNAFGVIMTGMGDDGASGLKEMHEAGASTVAQDKETCVIYGMPAVAVEKGGVDQQLPLQSISGAIMKFGSG